MTTQTEALKLALEAAKQAMHWLHTGSQAALHQTYVIRYLNQALAQPEQEPDLGGHDVFFAIGITRPTAEEVSRQPEQEPVAIHQFRSPHCSDWYDGVPDHHDGHGPYEVRTLYITPPQRKPWVSLSDDDIVSIAKKARSKDHAVTLAMRELKEKNT